MTMSFSPLMPDQVVECIATGRDPTVQELFEVAERVWTDGASGRSAFGWGRLSPGSSDRLVAIRCAQLALSGNGDPVYAGAAKETIMGKDAGEDPDLRLPARNPDWSADVTTQSGYAFHLKQASLVDDVALAEFSRQFDPDDLQSRFIAAGEDADGQQEHASTDSDIRRSEHFLAIERDTDRIIATATMAIDRNTQGARAALVIRPDYKSGGIRWKLLEHIAHFAASNCVRTLEAIDNRGDREPAELDGRPDWTASPYRGDPTLTLWRRSLDRL